MRSIKVFFIVLAGLILLSLALRLFIPIFIIAGIIGLIVLVGRRIRYFVQSRMGYEISEDIHRHRQGPPWTMSREPLFYDRYHHTDSITDVEYIEVKG